LREACPDGIDLYFDNVGGEILNDCLGQLAMRGRVVLCGAISGYNSREAAAGPVNYINLLIRRGRMEGFIILDYLDRFPAAQAEVGGWLASGRLQSSEHIVEGLENAPQAPQPAVYGGQHREGDCQGLKTGRCLAGLERRVWERRRRRRTRSGN